MSAPVTGMVAGADRSHPLDGAGARRDESFVHRVRAPPKRAFVLNGRCGLSRRGTWTRPPPGSDWVHCRARLLDFLRGAGLRNIDDTTLCRLKVRRQGAVHSATREPTCRRSRRCYPNRPTRHPATTHQLAAGQRRQSVVAKTPPQTPDECRSADRIKHSTPPSNRSFRGTRGPKISHTINQRTRIQLKPRAFIGNKR